MRHERDGGVETSLEVVSGVDEGAEQDFEACVLEWESRVGLWDQLTAVRFPRDSTGVTFFPKRKKAIPQWKSMESGLQLAI